DVVRARQPALGDHVPLPDFVILGLAAVLEPDNVSGLVLDHNYVGMPIAIEVADGEALEPAWLMFGDKMLAKLAYALVLEPVEMVVRGVGADQVKAAVAGEVGSADAIGVAVFVHD